MARFRVYLISLIFLILCSRAAALEKDTDASLEFNYGNEKFNH